MKSRQKIQTKRNSKNKFKWETKVNYAVRQINKARYHKLLSRYLAASLKIYNEE